MKIYFALNSSKSKIEGLVGFHPEHTHETLRLGIELTLFELDCKSFRYIHPKLKLKKQLNFIADLERQILGEPNQVRTVPKRELKRVYWNLIRVKGFTLKFTAHDDHLDDGDEDDLDDGEDEDEEDVDYGPQQAPAAIRGV